MKKVLVILGILMAVLAVTFARIAYAMSWQPGAEFDALGFLWLLDNLPKLAVWLLSIALAIFSVCCFGLAKQSMQPEEERFARRFGAQIKNDDNRPIE